MAWPGTSLEKTQIFQHFGIPQNSNPYAVYAVATIFGSFGEPFATTTIVAQLNTALDAVTADQYTQIQEQLARLTAIGRTSQVRIMQTAAGSKGVIVDYPKEREDIRRELANIIGFTVPTGGFYAEKRASGGLSR